MIQQLREGDVVVIWKLDRIGRSLKDLVSIINRIQEKGAGLKSLNDHIDTTTPHGRLTFHLFASLAEFERDIIRERTKAGLEAARARGRKGGRPKGLSQEAEHKAIIAKQLYEDGKLSVSKVCKQLSISKMTLYKYLRHKGVEIATHRKKTKLATVDAQLWVENNSSFVRGRKKSIRQVEWMVYEKYEMKKQDNGPYEYLLNIPYLDVKDLTEKIEGMLQEIHEIVDLNHCFAEASFHTIINGKEMRWD